MIPNLPKFKSLVSNSRENYIQANYKELVELYTDTENCIDALNQIKNNIMQCICNNIIEKKNILLVDSVPYNKLYLCYDEVNNDFYIKSYSEDKIEVSITYCPFCGDKLSNKLKKKL